MVAGTLGTFEAIQRKKMQNGTMYVNNPTDMVPFAQIRGRNASEVPQVPALSEVSR
jgi:hypothetical protein